MPNKLKIGRPSLLGNPNTYKYMKKLGEGGFGYVYLAQDKDYERFVAVKEMKINAQDIESTEKEIKAQIGCHDHENILKVIKYYEKESFGNFAIYCIVMEYCELGNLYTFKEQYIQQHGHSFTDTLAKSMMVQLASAVAHIHEKRIVHRDMKPENILVTEGRTPLDVTIKVGDFGLAKIMETSHQHLGFSSINHLIMSAVAGTMGYWAPEVWEVFKGLSTNTMYTDRVDVFALGLIFLVVVEPTKMIDTEAKAPMIRHLGLKQTVGEFMIRESEVGVKKHIFMDASFDLQLLVREMIAKNPYRRPKCKLVVSKLESVKRMRNKPIELPASSGEKDLRRLSISARKFGALRDNLPFAEEVKEKSARRDRKIMPPPAPPPAAPKKPPDEERRTRTDSAKENGPPAAASAPKPPSGAWRDKKAAPSLKLNVEDAAAAAAEDPAPSSSRGGGSSGGFRRGNKRGSAGGGKLLDKFRRSRIEIEEASEADEAAAGSVPVAAGGSKQLDDFASRNRDQRKASAPEGWRRCAATREPPQRRAPQTAPPTDEAFRPQFPQSPSFNQVRNKFESAKEGEDILAKVKESDDILAKAKACLGRDDETWERLNRQTFPEQRMTPFDRAMNVFRRSSIPSPPPQQQQQRRLSTPRRDNPAAEDLRRELDDGGTMPMPKGGGRTTPSPVPTSKPPATPTTPRMERESPTKMETTPPKNEAAPPLLEWAWSVRTPVPTPPPTCVKVTSPPSASVESSDTKTTRTPSPGKEKNAESSSPGKTAAGGVVKAVLGKLFDRSEQKTKDPLLPKPYPRPTQDAVPPPERPSSPPKRPIAKPQTLSTTPAGAASLSPQRRDSSPLKYVSACLDQSMASNMVSSPVPVTPTSGKGPLPSTPGSGKDVPLTPSSGIGGSSAEEEEDGKTASGRARELLQKDSGVHSRSSSETHSPPTPVKASQMEKGLYQILEAIDGSTVFRGYKISGSDRREVAIKRRQARLFDEAKMAFKEHGLLKSVADHPAFHNVLEYYRWKFSACIVMEFFEGVSLTDYVAQRKRYTRTLPPQTAKALLCQLSDGLRHLHTRGVTHRALMPDNVRVASLGASASPLLKIGGFSLALESAEAHPFAVNLLRYIVEKMEERKNLMFFTAPEALSGSCPVYTPAGDVFSVGLLYSMILERCACAACDFGCYPGAHRAGSAPGLTRVRFGDCHECLPIGLVLKGDPTALDLVQSSLTRDMGDDFKRLVKTMLHSDASLRPDASKVYQSTCAATEVFVFGR